MITNIARCSVFKMARNHNRNLRRAFVWRHPSTLRSRRWVQNTPRIKNQQAYPPSQEPAPTKLTYHPIDDCVAGLVACCSACRKLATRCSYRRGGPLRPSTWTRPLALRCTWRRHARAEAGWAVGEVPLIIQQRKKKNKLLGDPF